MRFSFRSPAKAPVRVSVQEQPANPTNYTRPSGLGWGLLVAL